MLQSTQIFTPSDVADVMAQLLFENHTGPSMELLEPCAGGGALLDAALLSSSHLNLESGRVTAVEKDLILAEHLTSLRESASPLKLEVHPVDFLHRWAEWLPKDRRFSHILLNPPYARLSPTSEDGKYLRENGVSVSNYYSAFLWLSIDLLEDGGTLVAIVPRSFCNGPHFREFRKHIHKHARITAIHHFSSRGSVFARDRVLQEVLVVRLERRDDAPAVSLSWSDGAADISRRSIAVVDQSRIVPSYAGGVITVPSSPESAARSPEPGDYLIQAPLTASTGSVVDFRMSDWISDRRSSTSVPLIGSDSLTSPTSTEVLRFIELSEATKGHIFAPGTYVVIRRISPRERRPRLDARLVDATGEPFSNGVAFENHLNVIHAAREGLPIDLARDLLAQLQSTVVEEQLIERVGSTQINIADILSLTREDLSSA